MNDGEPTDGGWAWVVLAASFFSTTLIGPVCYSYGVLLPEWIKEFQTSSAMASVIGSSVSGVLCFSCPISSFLILKWGCRTTQLIGGIAFTLAMIGCSFATSLLQIFILSAVLAGIGSGLCFMSSLIVTTIYFKSKRTIATGVVIIGYAFGTSVFPVVYEYLIVEYGWRGMMLIMGGVNLHMLAFGVIMCPVNEAPQINLFTCNPSPCAMRRDENHWGTMRAGEIINQNMEMQNQKERSWLNVLGHRLRHPFARKRSHSAQLHLGKERRSKEKVATCETNEAIDVSGLLVTVEKSANTTYLDQVIQLLKEPLFHVLFFHNITFYFGYTIVFVLTPLRALTDYAMTSQQGAILVSIMGFSHLFGRILWGFVASLRSMRPLLLFVLLRFFAGVITLASPVATSFGQNAVYCGFAGLLLGNWSIYPTVVAELFGDKLFAVAYGYLEVANGIGCVTGPLIGGYLYDVTNTYQNSFIAAGCSLVVGLVPLIASFLFKRTRGRREATVKSQCDEMPIQK